MHCIGEYPTANSALELDQIDFFKTATLIYLLDFQPMNPRGFRPRENGDRQGALIFERHVGLGKRININ